MSASASWYSSAVAPYSTPSPAPAPSADWPAVPAQPARPTSAVVPTTASARVIAVLKGVLHSPSNVSPVRRSRGRPGEDRIARRLCHGVLDHALYLLIERSTSTVPEEVPRPYAAKAV